MARLTADISPSWLERIESRLVSRWGARRGTVAAVACAMLAWSLVEHIGGLVMGSIPPLELVWLRYLVHLAFMLLVVVPWTGTNVIRTQFPAIQIGRSLLMLGMPICWVAAAQRMPLSIVMSIFWTTMIVATALAVWWLGEKPAPATLVLMFGGFVGALLVLRPTLPASRGGPVLAAGMSACFAAYMVGTRWLRQEPTQVNLFHSALSVFVVLSAVMPFIWQRPPLSAVLPVIAIGLLGYAILFLLDRALHLSTVAVAAPVVFLQPAIEAVWNGGPHGRAATLGIAMVLGAAMLAALPTGRVGDAATNVA